VQPEKSQDYQPLGLEKSTVLSGGMSLTTEMS